MRFKLVENLGELGRDLLTRAGHDVSTVARQGMSGWDDISLHQACCREKRVLVTLDRGFAEVLRFAPEQSSGIAVLDCRGRLSPPLILARISDLLAGLANHSIDRQLWIVEPGRVRVHARTDGDPGDRDRG